MAQRGEVPDHSERGEDLPSVAVLIRCKDEARFIGETLERVRSQRHRPDEIVVVDSGSTDGTLDIVRAFGSAKLVTMAPGEFSYGRSLNLGFAHAHSEVVVCLSAHAHPVDDRWLGGLLHPFRDPKIAGVYGRQLPQSDASPLVRDDTLRFYGEVPREQWDPARRDHHLFSSANSAVRRSVWEARPFDEELPYAEDIDWARAVLDAGHRLRYEPRGAVLHSHEESLRTIFWRTRQEYAAYARLYGRGRALPEALSYWYRATRRDLGELRREPGARRWMLHAPFYRLAKALGSVARAESV